MPTTISRQQALQRRQQYVTPGGAVTFVSTYLGTNKMEMLALGRSPEEIAQAAAGQPMVYLVEQLPNQAVDPHFHEVEQFQLFVGGGGTMGRTPLHTVTVHYAGPHSAYGPIVAGSEGVEYVTVRPDWDRGAQWMPDAAAALRAVPNRRQVAFTSEPLQRCTQLHQLQDTSTTLIMDPARHGAGAWQVCAGPGTPLRRAAGVPGGRFWYVLAGSLLADSGELAAGACLHQSPADGAFACRAGAEGVEFLELLFAVAHPGVTQ